MKNLNDFGTLEFAPASHGMPPTQSLKGRLELGLRGRGPYAITHLKWTPIFER